MSFGEILILIIFLLFSVSAIKAVNSLTFKYDRYRKGKSYFNLIDDYDDSVQFQKYKKSLTPEHIKFINLLSVDYDKFLLE